MGINCMSLAVWLGEDRKCSAAVVGLDLLLGLFSYRVIVNPYILSSALHFLLAENNRWAVPETSLFWPIQKQNAAIVSSWKYEVTIS